MGIPYKILIVEDDADFCGFLEKLLSRKGYKVLAAGNGREAFDYVNEDIIDIALLDVRLPDIDGYVIMERILAGFPKVPVIMMTGNASIDSAVKALKNGAYDYLEKPFASEKLLNTIRNALEHRRLESGRKRALEKLGESEEKYQRLFDSVTDALVIFDAETLIFEDANRAALNLFGYSMEEFLTLTPEDISVEKEKTQIRIDNIRNKRPGTEHVPERYLQKKDGTIFPGEISGATFISGGRKKIIGSIRDITKRIKAEKKLRESQERFRNLVENSLVGIAIIQDNKFVYQNRVQDKLYGPIPDQTILQTLKVLHPDDVDKVKAVYEKVVSRDVQTAEVVFRFYPSGKIGPKPDIRWVQCRATPFKYRGREAILVNAIDITDAKQLENQLIIKNKMLSLGRVAAGIAHEIRNPLTGINSYLFTLAELCKSEILDAEDIKMMQQIVEQIQVASNKIESVIKRVMDFSKPGAPKMVLTDINQALQEAMQLSVVTLRKNNIKLERELTQNLPQCYIDPQLIEQVMLNLINNAANAMENGNGTKTIRVKSYAGKNTVCIGVSDSGPGVPYKLRDKIFDPFFTTKEDGQGIGLNIAQRIIADHNGSLTLDTSEWGGAKFRIELPVEKRMDPR
jgi:PAS domain S-box-containing protein